MTTDIKENSESYINNLLKYTDYTSSFEEEEKKSIASKIKTKNITIAILGISLISACVAIAVMMPLKEKIPVLIAVDKINGNTKVMTNTDVEQLNVDKNQALDISNIANYVITREGYDWNYGEDSYNKISLMTSPDILKDYKYFYSDENPNALHKKYSNLTRVVVENVDVQFFEQSALVRFVKKIIHPDKTISTNEAVTIAYHYVSADMSEKDRMINPLGFQVISYRVNKDLAKGDQ